MAKTILHVEPPRTLVAAGLAAVALGLATMLSWRWAKATQLYAGQCDVALANPRFANPELLRLDFRARTADGDRETFERYEWFVARLVYVLDECLELAPIPRWYNIARTQLAAHKAYLGSAYYAQQDYLPHYSWRMRSLIAIQRAG